jgi:hypothetical protein
VRRSIRSEFAAGCFTVKISTADGKPIANINSGKPRCSMRSSTVDIVSAQLFKLQILEQLLNIILLSF